MPCPTQLLKHYAPKVVRNYLPHDFPSWKQPIFQTRTQKKAFHAVSKNLIIRRQWQNVPSLSKFVGKVCLLYDVGPEIKKLNQEKAER